VTAGIVSAVGRDVDIIDAGTGIEDFIQTDAAINPGNSGGALVNLNGELVGINTAIATESGSNEGYGFAVPSNLVARVARDLIEHGEVLRGYLGVTVLPVTADRARSFGMDRATGVELQEVAFGLAAHRAGLRAGDVLLAINDYEIDEPNQLQSAVARRTPGDTLRVRFWRDRIADEMNVVILGLGDPATGRWFARQLDEPRTARDDIPNLGPPHETLPELGLVVAAAGQAIQRSFDHEGGVYVLTVLPSGPASSIGLHEDVLIVSVNGAHVSSVDDLRSAVGKAGAGEPVLVETVRRGGSHFFYEIPVKAD
jgi:S1-C subfamily serine protease